MEARDAIRVKLLKKAKDAINQKLAGREIHIIKAVNLLSDLDSVGNLLKENASEWKIRKPTGEAENAFEELEKNTASIDTEKKTLMEFIEKEMALEFPNFSVLATPIIGAKLLASAGSKKRLAFMPASTIQLLGAEKALFAHLRRNAKSPKHGHLFNHPLLQKLPRFKRGKAARIIAGKLAIALKQDYFNGENTSSKTLKELEEQISKLAAEPVTPKQQEKEKMLEKQHEEGFNKITFEKTPFGQKPESRTWTPQERREFFAKQNQDKPFPSKENEEKRKPRKEEEFAPREERQFRERSYPQKYPRRDFGPRPRRPNRFGPKREGNYPPRREGSFRPRREEGFSGAREGGYQRGDRFGERREGSYAKRGKSTYGPKTSNYGPKRESFEERSERPFRPRERRVGEDRGGSFGANKNFGERKRFGAKKKFVKRY